MSQEPVDKIPSIAQTLSPDKPFKHFETSVEKVNPAGHVQ